MLAKDLKKKELERLLSENKITLDQYVEAWEKLENSPLPTTDDENSESTTQEANIPKYRKQSKPVKKIAIGIILCIVILVSAVAFIRWLPYSENLTIQSYDLTQVQAGALSFKLKNSGTSDIQIINVEMNGYPNQSSTSLAGSSELWIGTPHLAPNSEGTIFVNLNSYFAGFVESKYPVPAQPTEEEIANFVSTMNSTIYEFTFITSTNREYSIDVPNLFSMIAQSSQSHYTIGFMGSSSVTITNVDFNTMSTISLNLKNTGTKAITIATAKINNQAATLSYSGENNTLSMSAGDFLKINLSGAPAAWVNGNTYKIDLYDPNNQVIGSTQVNAPGA